MITKKEATDISILFNSVCVAKYQVDQALKDKNQEDIDLWMESHDKACDELKDLYKITVHKYNVRKYFV